MSYWYRYDVEPLIVYHPIDWDKEEIVVLSAGFFNFTVAGVVYDHADVHAVVSFVPHDLIRQ